MFLVPTWIIQMSPWIIQMPFFPCMTSLSMKLIFFHNFLTADRKCWLSREENQDLYSLIANHLNITCECQDEGYEWSSRFGLCVDVNECTQGLHNCVLENGQICVNLPGSFDCICNLGHVYNSESQSCVSNEALKKALEPSSTKDEDESLEEKSIFSLIVKAVTASSSLSTRHQRQQYDVLLVFSFISLRLLLLQ